MNRNISFCKIFASRIKKVQKTSAPVPASALPAFKEKKNLQCTLNQVSLALKYNEIQPLPPKKCFHLLKTTLSRLLGCFVLDVNVSYEYIAYICI